MTAIDLSRDLELWVDFDSEYWDAQRNQIQDKSGYGRHPEANGGPTIGVEGPASFTATGFDNTDDYFDTGETFSQAGDQTTFGIYNPNNLADFYMVFTNHDDTSNEGMFLGTVGNGGLGVRYFEGGSDYEQLSFSTEPNEWHYVATRKTEDRVELWYEGDVVDSGSAPNYQPGQNTAAIGRDSDQVLFWFPGQIAHVSRWHRALSTVEIRQLMDLTGPRRAIV